MISSMPSSLAQRDPVHMDLPLAQVSWLGASVTLLIAWLLTLTIYRLAFHPLAHFPGSRLARITRYVEGYYDVFCNGHYTHKIAQQHNTYGKIIRISPYELHINDPSFFTTLYSREGRWNKYDWAYDAHGTPLSTLSAIDHDVHKRRRTAINPFFSKQRITAQQDTVKRLSSRLCQRLEGLLFQEVKLASALGAFTRDVATEFLLGKTFDNLGADDFCAGVGATLQESGAIWRITKHLRWYGSMIKAVPLWLVKQAGGTVIVQCLEFVEDMEKTANDIHSSWVRGNSDVTQSPTIVDMILNSNLPTIEKTPARIKDEVITVAGAAFETTAYTLSKTLYHIYTDPSILRRLREELGTHDVLDRSLSELENLEYLTAVVREGLRLSPAIATRMARVTPDRPLVYDKWTIPPGTPVGMTLLLLHTDPVQYPDPMRFDPGRWLSQDTKLSKRAYAPFGQGTRMCIGMHLAWAELYFAVASIVTRFDFDFGPDALKDVTWASDQFTIGTETRNGLPAIVRHYDPQG
ncbi:cytochrome P450 [Xylariaceae sp. FL1272]|nr:cytochrome P450 [Xylariaceae sp. FL1272]